LGLILVAALDGVSAFAALVLLYRYLKWFIIQTFLSQKAEETNTGDNKATILNHVESNRIHELLSKAFLFLLVSAFARVMLSFFEAFLSITEFGQKIFLNAH
jgi:hypothetical protein